MQTIVTGVWLSWHSHLRRLMIETRKVGGCSGMEKSVRATLKTLLHLSPAAVFWVVAAVLLLAGGIEAPAWVIGALFGATVGVGLALLIRAYRREQRDVVETRQTTSLR